MLNLLGTIGANALSLPGILGVAVGMMTRSYVLAAIFGAGIGVAETFVFAGLSLAGMEALELVVGVAVGTIAGCLGAAIRRRGTTA